MPMNGISLIRHDGTQLIDGFANYIQNAPQGGGSDGDGYRATCIDRFHASYEAFGRFHSDAATTPFTQVLLNLYNNAYRLWNVETFAQDSESLIYRWQLHFFEFNVYDGTNYL
jgi:hypothetical protein